MINLTDDGTLDTVLECGTCSEQMRYNYDGVSEGENRGPDISYQTFIIWAIEDARFNHNCTAEIN